MSDDSGLPDVRDDELVARRDRAQDARIVGERIALAFEALPGGSRGRRSGRARGSVRRRTPCLRFHTMTFAAAAERSEPRSVRLHHVELVRGVLLLEVLVSDRGCARRPRGTASPGRGSERRAPSTPASRGLRSRGGSRRSRVAYAIPAVRRSRTVPDRADVASTGGAPRLARSGASRTSRRPSGSNRRSGISAPMMAAMHYLDHAATSPILPEVREAMLPFLDDRGGTRPASTRPDAKRARVSTKRARSSRSRSGRLPRRSSSPAAAPRPTTSPSRARRGRTETKGRHILLPKIEHHAVLDAASGSATRGFEIEFVPVRRRPALVDAADLVGTAPRRHDPRLPDAREQRDRHDRTGRRGRGRSAVSAACSRSPTPCRRSARSDVDVKALGVDLAAFSAHKIGGAEGNRRAVRPARREGRPAHARRRTGARPAVGDREPGRRRRLRDGCRDRDGRARHASPALVGAARPAARRALRAHRRRATERSPDRSGCRTTSTCRSAASSARTSCSMLDAQRHLRVDRFGVPVRVGRAVLRAECVRRDRAVGARGAALHRRARHDRRRRRRRARSAADSRRPHAQLREERSASDGASARRHVRRRRFLRRGGARRPGTVTKSSARRSSSGSSRTRRRG